MKKVLLASLICLSSLVAMAQPVSLKPGSSIIVNGDEISCLGPSEDQLPELCTIKQSGRNYLLYIGNSVAQTYSFYDDALAGASKTKEAGLCR